MKTRGQSGSAILGTLISVFAMAVTAGFLMQEAQVTMLTAKNPRIRSAMTTAEGLLRAAALRPSSYNCPSQADPSLCTGVDESFLVRIPIPGAQCPQGSGQCGVVVESQVVATPNQGFYNPATRQVLAVVKYTGTDFAFRERRITVNVPPDILYPTTTCPPATPIFVGYAANGSPRCNPIPGTAACGPGQYVSFIDGFTLSVQCSSLPADLTCRSDELLSAVRWSQAPGDAAAILRRTCTPKLDPFTYYAFTPTVARGPANTSPPLASPPDNPPPPFQRRRPAPPPVTDPNGICGPANGQTLPAPPVIDLCTSTWGSTPVFTAGTSATWLCLSDVGGAVASCSATISVGPVTTCPNILWEKGALFADDTSCNAAAGAGGSNVCAPGETFLGCLGGVPAYKACCQPAAVPLDGVCGLSNGQSFPSAPTANLCNSTFGNTPVTATPTTFNWSCQGDVGGNPVACQAALVVTPTNGVCGSSNGQTFLLPPSSNLCTSTFGNSPVTDTGTNYTWSCLPDVSGAPASCAATKQQTSEPGLCGPANGQLFAAAPSAGLCSSTFGNSAVLSLGTTFSWGCLGNAGGPTANCSASLQPTCLANGDPIPAGFLCSAAGLVRFPWSECCTGQGHQICPAPNEPAEAYCGGGAAPPNNPGVCGNANGQRFPAYPPTGTLCSAGSVQGPRNGGASADWECVGTPANAANTVSCSAVIGAVALPVRCSSFYIASGGMMTTNDWADTTWGRISSQCPYPTHYMGSDIGQQNTDHGRFTLTPCGRCGPGSTISPPVCYNNPDCGF